MCDKKLLWEGGSLSRPRYGGRAGLSTCHVETGSRSGAGHPVVSCPGQPAVRSMEAVTAAAVIMQWQPWCTRSPDPAWQLAWYCSQGLVHGSEASAASMTRLSWPECHVIMTVITISLLCFNPDWWLLTCTMDSPTKIQNWQGRGLSAGQAWLQQQLGGAWLVRPGSGSGDRSWSRLSGCVLCHNYSRHSS